MTVLRLHAPAKLNLGLRVVGRRADGYHLLDTVFHAIDLHDTLWLEDSDELALEVLADGGGSPVPVDGQNLVLAAARAFHAAAGFPPRGRFRLHKQVPAGGGLGGGSSDAAAALLLLQHRHQGPLSASLLAETALRLGADVPFFLRVGTQRGTGVGEVLQPVVPAPVAWFVLLVPPFGTSTAAVFKNLRPELTLGAATATNPRGKLGSDNELWAPSELCTRWHNDLESSAEQLYPDLAHLRAAVVEAGYPAVTMSGSGSTLFVAFDDPGRAAVAQARLRQLAAPGLRVLLTRTADDMVASRVPSVEA